MNLRHQAASRWGFTITEMLFVIVIGTVLTSLTLSGVHEAQASIASRQAIQMYATLHQRARARAIELGETVRLHVDADGDSVYLEAPSGVSDATRFRERFNVDLRAAPSVFFLCMTPRGYADPDCPALGSPATTNAAISLEFWRDADSSTVMILPMGQLAGI
jgi:type II secretory pathway pseudopilin PulG